MITIGPYLTFLNNEPHEWRYFNLDPQGVPTCYTSPFLHDQTTAEWTEIEMTMNDRLYVYDPVDKKSYCYLIDINHQLRRIPLEVLAGIGVARLVQKPIIMGMDISWPNEKMSRDNTVDPKQYPRPKITTEFIQPSLSAQLMPEQSFKTKTIDPFMAQDSLQVKQFYRIESKTHCPETLVDGSMYAWKQAGQWHYRVGILGDIHNGAFDNKLDASIVEKLNSSPIQFSESFLMGLSRPYLKLSRHQQMLVIGMVQPEWPLISGMNEQEKISICQALLARRILPTNTYETQISNENIDGFRRCLFPSNINALGPSFYPTSTKNVNIADIIRFIDYLLLSSLRELGHVEPITLKTAPSDSHVPCGEYQDLDGHFTQLYAGLNEGESNLFQLVLTYESQGLDTLSAQELVELKTHMEGIMAPQINQDYMSVSNNILAAIEAQQSHHENSQELAKRILISSCLTIIRKIEKQLTILKEHHQLLVSTDYKTMITMEFHEFIHRSNILTSIKADWLIDLIQSDNRIIDLICLRIIKSKAQADFFIRFFTSYWEILCPILAHNNALPAYVDYLMAHPDIILLMYIKLVKRVEHFENFYSDDNDELCNRQSEAAKWLKSLLIGEKIYDETEYETHQPCIISDLKLNNLFKQVLSFIERMPPQVNPSGPGR